MSHPQAEPNQALSTTTTTSLAAAAEEPWINRKASSLAERAANARKTSGRRRMVDPATSEHDYSTAELEFMAAMQEYKKRSGRLFPTWCEVLEVLQDLGYKKPSVAASLGDSAALS